MKYFSAPGSKTSSIPLKNPERDRRGEEAEGKPGAGDGGEGADGEDTEWADGG